MKRKFLTLIAAVAAGADGLEIEVHDNPQCAWSDGAQCLKPEKFAETIANCRQPDPADAHV